MPPLRFALSLVVLVVALFARPYAARAAAPPPSVVPPGTTNTLPTVTTAAPIVAPNAFSSAGPRPQATPPPPIEPPSRLVGPFAVTAQHVTFYSNRYVVSADDDVKLEMSDGSTITGDTFSMDLRLNRFVIAGDVTLRTKDGTVTQGAAFAEFFDFDRSYFLPIGTEPDRWTYARGDFSKPLLGREMPGDTFFLPDLSTTRVFLRADRAYIAPRESVRFTPAKINFGLTYAQFPEYFLNFSINPNFEQNSLPGAYVDGPLDFLGGEHFLLTAHIRYDPENKIFPALELHQVSQRHYIVASISPITRPLKQYNLLTFDRISPKIQAQAALQETAFQQNFQQPVSATAYGNLRVTGALRESFLQFNNDSYYDSLLAQPPLRPLGLYYGDPNHNWVPNHPTDEELTWSGFQHPLIRNKLLFTLRSGFGTAHDGIGPIGGVGGVNYNTIWNHFIGANLVVPSLQITADTHGQRVYFNASYDRQYQYYSIPHVTDTQSENVSISKLYNWKLAVFAGYSIGETRDFWGVNQDAIYPSYGPIVSPVNNLSYDGYEGFRGFATTRSLTQNFVYAPAGPYNVIVSFRENRDFPRPIPEPFGGLFQYGVSPYQATIEVRYRFNRIINLDVSRSYFFNFGGYEKWSPQFGIQVLK